MAKSYRAKRCIFDINRLILAMVNKGNARVMDYFLLDQYEMKAQNMLS